MKASNELIKELALTMESCGTEISDGAARLMLSDLSPYPESAVTSALKKLRFEHSGRLTLAAIISRIDDGRPGVEEAWAMYPKDESESAAVTEEMHLAMRSAYSLIQDGDRIGARMAFKEAYGRIVSQSRSEGAPVRWQVTLGHDRASRETALTDAATKGLIGADYAMKMLPVDAHERFCEAIGQPELLPDSARGMSSDGVKRISNVMSEVFSGDGRSAAAKAGMANINKMLDAHGAGAEAKEK